MTEMLIPPLVRLEGRTLSSPSWVLTTFRFLATLVMGFVLPQPELVHVPRLLV